MESGEKRVIGEMHSEQDFPFHADPGAELIGLRRFLHARNYPATL